MKKAVVLALAAIMVLGVAGAAFADADVFEGVGGPPLQATNSASPVQVKAVVNPRLTLTITTPDAAQTVDFGTAVPGTPETQNVTLDVRSNKAWTGDVTVGGEAALIGLTTATDAGGWDLMANYGIKGEQSFTDAYTINVPWDTDPNTALDPDYVATVTYTVTQ